MPKILSKTLVSDGCDCTVLHADGCRRTLHFRKQPTDQEAIDLAAKLWEAEDLAAIEAEKERAKTEMEDAVINALRQEMIGLTPASPDKDIADAIDRFKARVLTGKPQYQSRETR